MRKGLFLHIPFFVLFITIATSCTPGLNNQTTATNTDATPLPLFITLNNITSPAKNRNLNIIGKTTPSTLVSFFNNGTCNGTAINTSTSDSLGGFTFPDVLTSDGSYLFSAQASNDSEGAVCSSSLTYVLDTTPPQNPTISINGGATEVNQKLVTLILSATETVSLPMLMCISEATDCSGCAYAPYSTSSPFTFSSGVGEKFISVKYKDGSGNESACVSSNTFYEDVIVNPQFSLAPNWMDYIEQNATTQAYIPTNPCTGTENGTGTTCSHGGDKKSVTITGQSSCSGLSMVDSLGAFTWACDASSGTAIFTSVLATNKGLKNLIKSDGSGWNTDQVTLTGPAGLSLQSGLKTWWTNPIQVLSSSSSLQTLGTSGTIYAITSPITVPGIQIASSKVGIFSTSSTASLTSSTTANNCNINDGTTNTPNYTCLIFSGSNNFLWAEGYYDAVSATNTGLGLFFYGSKFSTINNLNLANASYDLFLYESNFNFIKGLNVNNAANAGIFVTYSTYNYFTNTESNNNDYGIELVNSSNSNMFWNIQTSNSTSSGIVANNTSNSNTFSQVVTSNNGGQGVLLAGNSEFNSFVMVTSNNNVGAGVEMQTGANYNTVVSLAAINNAYGVKLVSITQSMFSNLAITNNSTSGIYMSSGNANQFAGSIVLGYNGGETTGTSGDCNVTAGVPAGLTSTAGANGSCSNNDLSTAAFVTGKTNSTSFIGQVTTELANENHTGLGSYPSNLDWSNFDNSFQMWGNSGTGFPTSGEIGFCTGLNTCSIWDWTLALASSIIRNNADTGSSDQGTFVSTSCPNAVKGSDYIIVDSGTDIYLKNAVRLMVPGVYTDGLCDQNDVDCLYTPNFGAYQGESTMVECPYVDNGINHGIIIHGYTVNGH